MKSLVDGIIEFMGIIGYTPANGVIDGSRGFEYKSPNFKNPHISFKDAAWLYCGSSVNDHVYYNSLVVLFPENEFNLIRYKSNSAGYMKEKQFLIEKKCWVSAIDYATSSFGRFGAIHLRVYKKYKKICF